MFLFDVGFQLSYLAVFAIVAIALAIYLWSIDGSLVQARSGEFVHCFTIIEHDNGGVEYLGHPPVKDGVQLESIKTNLNS